MPLLPRLKPFRLQCQRTQTVTFTLHIEFNLLKKPIRKRNMRHQFLSQPPKLLQFSPSVLYRRHGPEISACSLTFEIRRRGQYIGRRRTRSLSRGSNKQSEPRSAGNDNRKEGFNGCVECKFGCCSTDNKCPCSQDGG
jgi:hypothetical protein